MRTLLLLLLLLPACGGEDQPACAAPAGTYLISYALKSHDCPAAPSMPDELLELAQGEAECGLRKGVVTGPLANGCSATVELTGEVDATGLLPGTAVMDVHCSSDGTRCSATFDASFERR